MHWNRYHLCESPGCDSGLLGIPCRDCVYRADGSCILCDQEKLLPLCPSCKGQDQVRWDQAHSDRHGFWWWQGRTQDDWEYRELLISVGDMFQMDSKDTRYHPGEIIFGWHREKDERLPVNRTSWTRGRWMLHPEPNEKPYFSRKD